MAGSGTLSLVLARQSTRTIHRDRPPTGQRTVIVTIAIGNTVASSHLNMSISGDKFRRQEGFVVDSCVFSIQGQRMAGSLSQ